MQLYSAFKTESIHTHTHTKEIPKLKKKCTGKVL